MAESSYYPIYAKESKDVPEWMKSSHEWQAAVAVDKLPKYQLKVKMCCLKCEEKVIEEIREVPGVFDVRAERLKSKVVVVASTPSELDEHEVLRRARKINRNAEFVPLDDKEKPKKADDKKKEEEKKKDEDKKKKEEEEKKKKEKELAESIYTFKPSIYWGAPPYYTPEPVAYMPGEYRPSQNYAPRYHYPPLPGQPEDGHFRQYVYHS